MSDVPWRADLERRVRRLSVASAVGLASGAVIGGIGGRLAMLLLRVTSDPVLLGVKTDDEFVIGRFSADTFFLIIFTAVIGALAGAMYLVARVWLPQRHRPLFTGVLAGLVGGAVIVKPHGVDFTRLEPHWLAIALFVLIPGLYGVAMSVVVERRLATAGGLQGRAAWLGLLFLLPLLIVGPLGLFVVLIFAGSLMLVRRVPSLAGAFRSSVGMALGRALLLAIAALSTVDLVRDAAAIL